jgi:hypothetical protein
VIARTLAIAALLLVASALAPSCAAPGTPLAITYLAAWDADGARTNDDGTWSTTTDLGFDVRVLDGQLTTYATTLVPCDAGTVSARVERVRAILGPPIAHAGHLDHPDASMIEPNAMETIAPGETTTLGTSDLATSASYCRVHQLVGGRVDTSGETPVRLPSLSIALDVTDAAGAPVRTVDLSTTIATGTLADLPARPDGAMALEVTWTRPLARLFDGIDFSDASLTTPQIAQAMLLTIAASSRAEARWSDGTTRTQAAP